MEKSCCAVGCTNRFSKGMSDHFYRFPGDPARRARWIAAVNGKDWTPNEHSCICSDHFISGEKSNDPPSPNYMPCRLSSSTYLAHLRGSVLETWRGAKGSHRLKRERSPKLIAKQTDVIKDCTAVPHLNALLPWILMPSRTSPLLKPYRNSNLRVG